MSADLRAKIVAIPCWYHRIALPDGLVTPGWAPPLAPERHQLPEDVTGLRILDVGAWDSYWTFDALERGAEEVLAIDDFSDNLDEGHNVSRPKWETFNLCRDALGHSEERCQRKEMNILISRRKMSAASMSCFFRRPLSPAPPVASSRQAGHHWYGNYPWWKAPYATTTARIAA